jgi:hypothetical protein
MQSKKPQSRLKRKVNLTLDPETLDRLEALRAAHDLDSISQTVRWLARQAEMGLAGGVSAGRKGR